MTDRRTHVRLVMIVKNEERVIARCLDSVRGLIDSAVICDTGSTDGTVETIQEWRRRTHVPTYVHLHSWVDFAHNRNVALDAAEADWQADFLLVMDADDVMETTVVPDLDRAVDLYDLEIVHAGIRHWRPQIIRAGSGWRYRGVIHEFLDGGTAGRRERLPLRIIVGQDGARRRSPDARTGDLDVLSGALASEQDPFLRSRYMFYLAQTLEELGRDRRALVRYRQRAELGGWIEERYVALLRAGRIEKRLGKVNEAIALWFTATQLVPTRAEAAYEAAVALREQGLFAAAMKAAGEAAALPRPVGLFVELAVYDYLALDELVVSAYHAGQYRASLVNAVEILFRELDGKVPAYYKKRAVENALFAIKKEQEEHGV